MGWESRKPSSRKFYYLAENRNGKTVKTYIGNGPEAHLIAAEVEAERNEKKRRKADELEAEASLNAADRAMDEFEDLTGLLKRALLNTRGCYEQRPNCWRVQKGARRGCKPLRRNPSHR